MISIDGVGDTPKALAKLLGAKRSIPKDYIFRYGKNTLNSINSKKVFNSTWNIFNKQSFLNGLARVVENNGIDYFKPLEIVSIYGDSYKKHLIYWRENHHARGDDIYISQPGCRLNTSIVAGKSFGTIGVDIFREYRYHFVFDNLIPCLKYHEGEIVNREDSLIRNYSHNWRFSICKPRDRLVRAAWWIKNMTKLDFGAIDLCIDNNDNVWVFEVNTAPSLDEINLNLYAKWFKEIVELYESGGIYVPLSEERPEDKKMSELFRIYQHETTD